MFEELNEKLAKKESPDFYYMALDLIVGIKLNGLILSFLKRVPQGYFLQLCSRLLPSRPQKRPVPLLTGRSY
jgi:hypothetical protein